MERLNENLRTLCPKGRDLHQPRPVPVKILCYVLLFLEFRKHENELVDIIVQDLKSGRFEMLLLFLVCEKNSKLVLQDPNILFMMKDLRTNAGIRDLCHIFRKLDLESPGNLVKFEGEGKISMGTIRERVATRRGRYKILNALKEKYLERVNMVDDDEEEEEEYINLLLIFFCFMLLVYGFLRIML